MQAEKKKLVFNSLEEIFRCIGGKEALDLQSATFTKYLFKVYSEHIIFER